VTFLTPVFLWVKCIVRPLLPEKIAFANDPEHRHWRKAGKLTRW
jgi:hypothetical protein